jgi:hypothetical protein
MILVTYLQGRDVMTHERRRFALALLGVALLVAGLAACAPKEEAAAPAEAPAAPAEPASAAEEHADHPAPGPGARIFFVEPANGATVTSPVKIVFGAENFIIEKRVEGVINPGAGHHHIGLDTQCLPPGEIIPTAAPWVHFGDGSSTIEFQLPPGEHHLVAQVGDGEHRTLDEPGLCAELDVVVVEGTAAPKEPATQ